MWMRNCGVLLGTRTESFLLLEVNQKRSLYGNTKVRGFAHAHALDNELSQLCMASEHKRTIRCVAWSPCGNYILSASHTSEVKSAAWSASGRYITSCGRDKSVWVWEFDDEEDASCASVLQLHKSDVKCVTWHDTEEVFASCGFDGLIKLYNEQLDDWCEAAFLDGHEGTVWSIQFQPHNPSLLLASAGDDCSLRIWSSPLRYGEDNFWNQYTCVRKLNDLHSLSIFSLSWSPCGRLLASASADNSFALSSVEQTKGSSEQGQMVQCETLHRHLAAHDQDVNCVAFRPQTESNKFLLTTLSDDLTIKFWTVLDPSLS
ncbi:cytosolic iron-sulfur protein assembly [Cichlidogyrus casuarinus]|uniref:Cytosolic iron-sulfur protein assembly n=1 Tax=Cichlidogyrus casuarinus TaxID=1844966 RepID=A0ABD2Q7V0_9PLAT